MSLADWQPSTLKATAHTLPKGGTVRIPTSMLPKLRVPHPGWLLASWLAEKAARELYVHAMLWLNGLVFTKFCAPVPASGAFLAPESSTLNCLTNQGPYPVELWEIPGIVADRAPGSYVGLLGFQRMTSIGTPRYMSQSYYQIVGTAVNGVRVRPFYAPAPRYADRSMSNADARFAKPGQAGQHIRPWPVWASHRPWADPAPTPPAPDVPGKRSSIDSWRWAWAGRGLPVSRPLPSNPAIPRTVPVGRTREVKFGANTAVGQLFFAVMKAREAVSELDDFVDVIFRALPKDLQRLYGGNRATLGDKMTAVFAHAGEIDGGLFIRNLIANQIEDEIIGRTWFKLRAQLRNSVFGNRMGSLGPVNNPLFQRYATAVSDFSQEVAKVLTGARPLTHEEERTFRAAQKRVADAWGALTRAPNSGVSGASNPAPG